MSTRYQRPVDLPENIQMHHTVHRDSDADLLLKVTALESNKTAVFPVFKKDMVEYLPNYFGVIFDKNKKYKFKENHLQKGEYFEIGIPNLKDPENFAVFLRDLCCNFGDDNLEKRRKHTFAFNGLYDYDLPEFYWIANYFNEESLLSEIYEDLSVMNSDFCHDLLLNYQTDQKFKDCIRDASHEYKKDYHGEYSEDYNQDSLKSYQYVPLT